MYIKYKKRIRLKEFEYKGYYRYFLTLCTQNKLSIFTDDFWVTKFINILKKISKHYNFSIWAYCFMPDHLHLLIEGKEHDSDMKQFISLYKQITGFYYKKITNNNLWQANYYEHVLRNEEDTIKIAYYIFFNPVRKGLVHDFTKYNFLGSFEFDIKKTYLTN